jgi:hypothetical protein
VTLVLAALERVLLDQGHSLAAGAALEAAARSYAAVPGPG